MESNRWSSLNIRENIPLASLTTFKIGGPARYFIELTDTAQIPDALQFAHSINLRAFILGGGSNLLVSDEGLESVVIHIRNRGILFREEANHVLLDVAAGEVWDDVVRESVQRGLWGIENLSRIPGQAGSIAVQNVGAYGVEASEVVQSVEVFDRIEQRVTILKATDCKFAYRTSIFNTSAKGRYIILSVTLALHREVNRRIGYPDLREWFRGNTEPSLEEIRAAIMAIRDRKFPFPAESIEGNAGSFFKNPLLNEQEYDALEANFAEQYPDSLERLRTIRNRFPMKDAIKIPGAFLLEVCGLKGFRIGNAMLNPAQPVIVLNATGTATASEILTLVRDVRDKVFSTTGITLAIEPELIGFSAKELSTYNFSEAEIRQYINY